MVRMVQSMGRGHFYFPASSVPPTIPGSAGAASGPRTMKIGAGGFIRGLDIAPDGTMVCNTDTYGAYKWNAARLSPGNAGGLGAWDQLVTPSSMPNGDPTSSLVRIQQFEGSQGVYEIRIAPSNSQIMFMAYLGYLFKSTNGGTTWTNLNASFTPTSLSDMKANDNGLRTTNSGPKMAIDPINPSVVYFSLQNGSPYVSFDGGATWTQMTGIPAPTATNFTGFAIDPRVSTQSGGVSTVAYAFSYGNGCYRSTNAGSGTPTWTKISGSGTSLTTLTTVIKMKVDSQGNLWVTDNAGGIFKFNGTTWTSLATQLAGINMAGQYFYSIAIDPNVANAQRIIFGGSLGLLAQTNDGGATLSGGYGPPSGLGTRTATDIPSLAVFTDDPTNGDMVFHPLTGKLMFASGVGVWSGNPPITFTSSPWIGWTSQSAGIEQLVANMVVSPPAGVPIVANWDRAFYRSADPEVYPATDEPIAFAVAPGGVSVDWASASPSTVVGLQAYGTLHISGDGGQTWSTKTGPGSSSLQMVAATSSTNFLVMPAGGNPNYTADGGATWNDLGNYFNTNFGIPLNSVNLFNNEQTACADRVASSTFYIHFGSCIFRSQNGGAAWSKMSTDGVGSGIPSSVTGLGGNPMMRTVYGKSGHLIFCIGQTYQGVHPYTAGSNTVISTDAGVTWADLSANVRDVWAIDTGVQVGTYPRITLWGYVNVSGTWTLGVWSSDDQGATWTLAAPYTMQGTLDIPKWLEVDKNNSNRFYIGYFGSGYSYYRP